MAFKEKTSAAKKYLAVFCFLWIMVLLPLYYRYAYFDMIEAKASALRAVLYAVCFGTLVFAAASCFGRDKKAAFWKKFCSLDWALLAFLAAVGISWLFADAKKEAFWGNEGWSVGAFVLAGCVLCYFLLSRHLPESQNLWLPVLIVNIVIFALVVLHCMGADVLSMHENMMQHEWYSYLSTIGQINALMGYLSLVFPVFAVFFLVSRQRISVILYGILTVLGEAVILLCASDGIYIAVGLCMFFLLPFVWEERTRMRRFLFLIGMFGLWITLISALPVFEKRLEYMRGGARHVLHVPIGIAVCLFALAGAVMMKKYMERETVWRRLLVWAEVLLGIAAGCVLCYTVYSFTVEWDWGSGRKYLWGYSLELFLDFPLKEKLFGVGPELLGRYYEDCYDYFGMSVLTAHSEFLQYLLTLGLAGSAAWLAVCVSVGYTFVRYQSRERMTYVYFLSLAAYFAQASVCSPQPLNAAVCCVMLACYRRSLVIWEE